MPSTIRSNQRVFDQVRTAISARFTLASAARAVKVEPSMLDDVLSGHLDGWPELRMRIADHLGVDRERLWGPDLSAYDTAYWNLRATRGDRPLSDAQIEQAAAIIRVHRQEADGRRRRSA